MIEINDQVLAELNSGFRLPPKPAILEQLQAELQQDEIDLQRIANIIAADVATAAAVLKIINSPVYGMSRTITDIRQAVMFLGLNAIAQIVTGYLLQQAFDQSKCCISLERFWDNAREVSEAALIIGKRLKTPVPLESLQLIGLFHDAGIPAMAMQYPNYIEVLTLANENSARSLIELEEQEYKCNHTVIGYYLANSWNLPKHICQMVLRHHDHSFLTEQINLTDQVTFATLKLAENLVHLQKRFSSIPEWDEIEEDVLAMLGWDREDYQDLLDDTESLFY